MNQTFYEKKISDLVALAAAQFPELQFLSSASFAFQFNMQERTDVREYVVLNIKQPEKLSSLICDFTETQGWCFSLHSLCMPKFGEEIPAEWLEAVLRLKFGG